uniref:hypothetical protein n=1 Tax=Gemmiger formicilis TaxID=745368 RepID=UPI004027FCFF
HKVVVPLGRVPGEDGAITEEAPEPAPKAAEPAAPAAPTQEELLAEILVELKKQNGEKTA